MILSTIAVTLLLLLPIGLGALAVPASGPDIATRLSFSWIVGVTAWVCVHVLQGVADFRTTSLALIAVSAFGLVRAVLRWERHGIKPTILALAAVLPVLVLTDYAFVFLVLSDYPLTNVFQEVQTFDAVGEFAKTGALYIGGADSYTPIRQVIYTTLYDLLGMNPLDVFFIAPLPLLVISALASFSLAQALFRGKHLAFQIAVAVAIGTVASPPYPTNGSLLNIVVLLALSIFLGQQDYLRQSWKSVGGLVAVSLLSLVAIALVLRSGQAPNLALASFIALAAFSLLNPAKWQWDIAGVVVLTFCAAALHRSALVFLPPAIMAGALVGLSAILIRGGHHRLLGFAMLAVAALASIFPTLVIMEELGLIAVSDRMESIYRIVAEVLLRQPLIPGSEIMMGTGARNALIELVRSVGPLTALVCGAVGVVSIFRFYILRSDVEGSPYLCLAAGSWIAAMGMFALIASGLPFVYRAGFLALTLLVISVTSFVIFWVESNPIRRGLGIALAMIISVLLCAFWLGAYSPNGIGVSEEVSRYLNLAVPFLGALLAVTFALSAGVALRPAMALPLLLVGAAVAFEADRTGITTRMMTFSYGAPPENIEAVSFYSEEEMRAMHHIGEGRANWVVVSDMVTVSIARTFGGALSPLPYSNLDSLSPEKNVAMKKALVELLSGQAGDFCAALLRQIDIEGSALLNARVIREDRDGAFQGAVVEGSSLRYLLNNRSDWTLVALVSPRTLAWLSSSSQDTQFFPIASDRKFEDFEPANKALAPISTGANALKAYEVNCP